MGAITEGWEQVNQLLDQGTAEAFVQAVRLATVLVLAKRGSEPEGREPMVRMQGLLAKINYHRLATPEALTVERVAPHLHLIRPRR